jgi:hypothetical protein
VVAPIEVQRGKVLRAPVDVAVRVAKRAHARSVHLASKRFGLVKLLERGQRVREVGQAARRTPSPPPRRARRTHDRGRSAAPAPPRPPNHGASREVPQPRRDRGDGQPIRRTLSRKHAKRLLVARQRRTRQRKAHLRSVRGSSSPSEARRASTTARKCGSASFVRPCCTSAIASVA